MEQEDKELLLKDLCTRLPYNCRVFYEYVDDLDGKTYGYSLTLNTWCIDEFIANKAVIKPYLRPMSSMTEEEKKEVKPLFSKFTDEFGKKVLVVRQNKMTLYQDWLNAHHFDYRIIYNENHHKWVSMIERGLALEASEGIYK